MTPAGDPDVRGTGPGPAPTPRGAEEGLPPLRGPGHVGARRHVTAHGGGDGHRAGHQDQAGQQGLPLRGECGPRPARQPPPLLRAPGSALRPSAAGPVRPSWPLAFRWDLPGGAGSVPARREAAGRFLGKRGNRGFPSPPPLPPPLPRTPRVPAGLLCQSGARLRHAPGIQARFLSFPFPRPAWPHGGSTADLPLGRAAGLRGGEDGRKKERGPLRHDSVEFTCGVASLQLCTLVCYSRTGAVLPCAGAATRS